METKETPECPLDAVLVFDGRSDTQHRYAVELATCIKSRRWIHITSPFHLRGKSFVEFLDNLNRRCALDPHKPDVVIILDASQKEIEDLCGMCTDEHVLYCNVDRYPNVVDLLADLFSHVVRAAYDEREFLRKDHPEEKLKRRVSWP